MRKFVLFCIVLFIMLFGLVAEPQQIQINVTILPQEPTFLMKASLVSDSGYVIGSINSNKDISVEDVEIFIKLYQTNRARIKGTYQLAVTANALSLDEENSTEAPALIQIDKFASNTDVTVTGDSTTLTIVYVKGKPFQPFFGLTNAGEFATLKATWTAKDELAPGLYTSYITLTSTAL